MAPSPQPEVIENEAEGTGRALVETLVRYVENSTATCRNSKRQKWDTIDWALDALRQDLRPHVTCFANGDLSLTELYCLLLLAYRSKRGLCTDPSLFAAYFSGNPELPAGLQGLKNPWAVRQAVRQYAWTRLGCSNDAFPTGDVTMHYQQVFAHFEDTFNGTLNYGLALLTAAQIISDLHPEQDDAHKAIADFVRYLDAKGIYQTGLELAAIKS